MDLTAFHRLFGHQIFPDLKQEPTEKEPFFRQNVPEHRALHLLHRILDPPDIAPALVAKCNPGDSLILFIRTSYDQSSCLQLFQKRRDGRRFHSKLFCDLLLRKPPLLGEDEQTSCLPRLEIHFFHTLHDPVGLGMQNLIEQQRNRNFPDWIIFHNLSS